ncbi:MerR family DNA-binding transcriptional regulator [Serratia plymuthica]|uniref:MerR family DNA-binding transcriptional regulator n=1 Tax=Serratia plymuthica TaxID=82996 RepID=UPI000FAEE9AA|nr:MerR family DNA-binding transcriptional regulator [Serratia plymuthica]QUY50630.1 MerR family DNA-binding transcriptional regulator [Serratia plymuthica]
MKIGELAERSGIAASAIRYYEQQGLLPKAVRGANGYRLYGQASLERLHLIQLGQSLGFTLETMGNLLALEGVGVAYEDSLTQNIEARLAEIDRVMATLSAQRESLLEAKRKLATLGIEGMCQETSDLVATKTARHRQKSDEVTTTSGK